MKPILEYLYNRKSAIKRQNIQNINLINQIIFVDNGQYNAADYERWWSFEGYVPDIKKPLSVFITSALLGKTPGCYNLIDAMKYSENMSYDKINIEFCYMGNQYWIGRNIQPTEKNIEKAVEYFLDKIEGELIDPDRASVYFRFELDANNDDLVLIVINVCE